MPRPGHHEVVEGGARRDGSSSTTTRTPATARSRRPTPCGRCRTRRSRRRCRGTSSHDVDAARLHGAHDAGAVRRASATCIATIDDVAHDLDAAARVVRTRRARRTGSVTCPTRRTTRRCRASRSGSSPPAPRSPHRRRTQATRAPRRTRRRARRKAESRIAAVSLTHGHNWGLGCCWRFCSAARAPPVTSVPLVSVGQRITGVLCCDPQPAERPSSGPRNDR